MEGGGWRVCLSTSDDRYTIHEMTNCIYQSPNPFLTCESDLAIFYGYVAVTSELANFRNSFDCTRVVYSIRT